MVDLPEQGGGDIVAVIMFQLIENAEHVYLPWFSFHNFVVCHCYAVPLPLELQESDDR